MEKNPVGSEPQVVHPAAVDGEVPQMVEPVHPGNEGRIHDRDLAWDMAHASKTEREKASYIEQGNELQDSLIRDLRKKDIEFDLTEPESKNKLYTPRMEEAASAMNKLARTYPEINASADFGYRRHLTEYDQDIGREVDIDPSDRPVGVEGSTNEYTAEDARSLSKRSLGSSTLSKGNIGLGDRDEDFSNKSPMHFKDIADRIEAVVKEMHDRGAHVTDEFAREKLGLESAHDVPRWIENSRIKYAQLSDKLSVYDGDTPASVEESFQERKARYEEYVADKWNGRWDERYAPDMLRAISSKLDKLLDVSRNGVEDREFVARRMALAESDDTTIRDYKELLGQVVEARVAPIKQEMARIGSLHSKVFNNSTGSPGS